MIGLQMPRGLPRGFLLAALGYRRQRRLLHLLAEIGQHPSRVGDFQEVDSSGRKNEVLLADEWLVTFWSDHASQESVVRTLMPPKFDPGRR